MNIDKTIDHSIKGLIVGTLIGAFGGLMYLIFSTDPTFQNPSDNVAIDSTAAKPATPQAPAPR
jgi:hypothetical protein